MLFPVSFAATRASFGEVRPPGLHRVRDAASRIPVSRKSAQLDAVVGLQTVRGGCVGQRRYASGLKLSNPGSSAHDPWRLPHRGGLVQHDTEVRPWANYRRTDRVVRPALREAGPGTADDPEHRRTKPG